MKINTILKTVAAVGALALASAAHAGPIKLPETPDGCSTITESTVNGVTGLGGIGGADRTAVSTNASKYCYFSDVTGTPEAAEIGTALGGSWTKVGALTGNGTNGLLTVNLTTGSWGGTSIAGTWSIDSNFFATYGKAAISMHVGNGNGDPDWWVWSVEEGKNSGSFAYSGNNGLSNLFLWGSGEPTQVPEPATLGLLGLGLAGVGFARRRKVGA